MRVILILAWAMIGLLTVAFHYGPGQKGLVLDDVGRFLQSAEDHLKEGEWGLAASDYEEALALLPPEKTSQARRIRSERAKALLKSSQLPAAYRDLELLMEELRQDPASDPVLFRDVQSSFAGARFYLTWLMRLEGLPRDVWEEEIEASRQTYRLLAEQAAARGDREAARDFQGKMESSIRLARMDLAELQGTSIPKQCQGCCSGNCKKPGNRPGKKKGKGKKKQDARGASSGPPPDDGGS